MLQKIAGCLEYVDLLSKAALADNSHQRILLIAAFAVTAVSGFDQGLTLPFPGLLGETYER